MRRHVLANQRAGILFCLVRMACLITQLNMSIIRIIRAIKFVPKVNGGRNADGQDSATNKATSIKMTATKNTVRDESYNPSTQDFWAKFFEF